MVIIRGLRVSFLNLVVDKKKIKKRTIRFYSHCTNVYIHCICNNKQVDMVVHDQSLTN